MVASRRRGGRGRRGGDSNEVRRGDAMGREFLGMRTTLSHQEHRQVSAKARETRSTFRCPALTNQRREGPADQPGMMTYSYLLARLAFRGFPLAFIVICLFLLLLG
ncbi:hypothetical protein V8C34DRAFT_266047 [Trichoderma compactum]